MPVRIRKTPEAVPQTGSYGVIFDDGREPVYFLYDDHPGRRAFSPDAMTSKQALQAAQTFARGLKEK